MKTTPHLDLISAAEASARLGIRRASLYAYVSRNLVRSFASPNDPRERLYATDDVEALVQRRTRLRRPAVAAATALDWGLPVLETSLTQIKDGRLFYRGRDAIAFASTATLDQAAGLLIGHRLKLVRRRLGLEPGLQPAFGADGYVSQAIRLLSMVEPEHDPGSDAAVILRIMAAAGSGADPVDQPFHEHFRRCWKAPVEADHVLRRALVLCADHELSASAFAVRVAASTGAKLHNAVIAGLAALSGVLHGGATDQVHSLLQACETPAGLVDLHRRLKWRQPVVGFHHQLYSAGDPRGSALLDGVPILDSDRRVLEEIARDAGGAPTIDAALVMVERAYGLPSGAAFVLFATGRTVGWLAHAVEQQAKGSLIRPRARYVLADQG